MSWPRLTWRGWRGVLKCYPDAALVQVASMVTCETCSWMRVRLVVERHERATSTSQNELRHTDPGHDGRVQERVLHAHCR